ncbi:casein kinase substrate phosphoprotein PP28-domain-containing protein [Obelidium mucronatum]|nr:casein kinase substrate phosphoprotein PP28-domain-containing protein [Obelidium mucronatum]
MSGAPRGKGKFNKTKRGVARKFTDGDAIDRSVEELEKMRIRNENSNSDSESGSESDSGDDAFGESIPRSAAAGRKPAEAIYRSTERQVVEIGKIEIEEPVEEFKTANANRAATKNLKASDLSSSAAVPMSRREKEALEAERKKAAFWKAQLEGKTDQAKSDLARLAIIKKQREEAARKKAEEAASKGVATGAKAASLNAGKGIIGKSLGGK